MAASKQKPEKNRGDTWMALGALMVALSVVLSFIGISLGSTGDQVMLYGGLVIAILGVAIRSSLRRKAKKSAIS